MDWEIRARQYGQILFNALSLLTEHERDNVLNMMYVDGFINESDEWNPNTLYFKN